MKTTLICGPMYSGKSTALLQILERSLLAKQKVLLLRPKKDDRGYFTHSLGIDLEKLKIKYPKILRILEISEYPCTDTIEAFGLESPDVVLVDEYFMIPGIHRLATFNREHCEIYFGGLLATSEAELFEETKKLLPHCDRIEKLSAVCLGYKKDKCGRDANYSVYVGKSKKSTEVLVDSNDKNYICLCSTCYSQFLKDQEKN